MPRYNRHQITEDEWNLVTKLYFNIICNGPSKLEDGTNIIIGKVVHHITVNMKYKEMDCRSKYGNLSYDDLCAMGVRLGGKR
jgi:hypothetical protein